MRTVQFQLVSPSPWIKRLLIANLAIWVVLQIIVEQLLLPKPYITLFFGLIPETVVESFFLWQPLTYMFLHSMNPTHILFNMMSLWFFGSELEQRWGSKFFITYYLVCGVGAAVIYLLGIIGVALIRGAVPVAYSTPVVGASGAIFGLLLAYGILFGDRMVYFFGAFPMKAKVFVLIIGGIELISLVNSSSQPGQVANLAHLGGLITGYLFLTIWTRRQQSRWRNSGKAKGNLKLVVNREDEGGPKYWN